VANEAEEAGSRPVTVDSAATGVSRDRRSERNGEMQSPHAAMPDAGYEGREFK